MSATQPRAPELLTETDRNRLEAFAPLFDVIIESDPTADIVNLRVLDRGGWRRSPIRKSRLHTRLLAEICAKTLRWVFFPLGTPCHEALLGLTDERITRISELYQQQKNVLLNLTPAEAAPDELAAA